MNGTTETDSTPAVGLALLRHAAAAILWILRYAFQRWHGGPPSLGTIALDAALVTIYVVWVNAPLQAALGSRFGKRPHWSAVFAVPPLVAIFILVRDFWFALRGIAL